MPDIEYFYSAHSAFAYLGSRRFLEIAAAAGRGIVHKPYDLRRGMVGIGSSLIRTRPDAHRAYFFGREIVRWAEHRGVPILGRRPTHHDNEIVLCNSVLIAALQQGHAIDALSHGMLEAHWRDDADLADASTLARIVAAAGIAPEPVMAAARSPAVHAVYEANTAEAVRRSVFGSPTYFVDGDMFYGQDHLEMVERALSKPYAGVWPPRQAG